MTLGAKIFLGLFAATATLSLATVGAGAAAVYSAGTVAVDVQPDDGTNISLGMPAILLHLAIALTPALSFAECKTTVSGSICGQIWTPDGSPYCVDGDILIPPSCSLRIDPGVRVEFMGAHLFQVQGILKAVGTEESKIIFTRAAGSDRWNSIWFDNAPSGSAIARLACTQ